MFVRVCAFVIWALVAGTAVFWGLRLTVTSPAAPSHAVPVGDALAVRGDLSRLLGAAPVATAGTTAASPELSSRFQLLGVMAAQPGPKAGESGQGVALIAVDGKPARAYVVGSSLDDQLVLQSVSLRAASIGPPQGDVSVRLEIPPLPAPATGTLPKNLFTPAAVSPQPLAAVPRPAAPPAMVAPTSPSRQPIQSAQPSDAPNGASMPQRDFGAVNR